MLNYLFEIKNRLLLILISFFSLVLISYCYKEILLFLLTNPYKVLTKLNSDYFIFTDVTELFSVYMKTLYCITANIIVILFVYHCFVFVSNGLFKQEFFFLLKLGKILLLFLFLSLGIANYILIPLSWGFFYNFYNLVANTFISLHFEPKINEYFNFCLFLYDVCIFYLQIIIILFYFIWYYTRSVQNIKKWRKLYYYCFLMFSTLISPPDLLSQLFISLSFVFFFEFLIIWSIFIQVTSNLNK